MNLFSEKKLIFTLSSKKEHVLNSSFLLVILCLAIFFRLFSLGDNPKGFFCDEASIGFNAYSLIKTGMDEWGKPWPLFFKAFGEYKNPIMTYSSIPSVYFLGLNQYSTRLPSAIYGILSIIISFLLFKKLFDPKTGLIVSFFLSISPWFVHLSRINLEGIVPMVFFILLGTFFWIYFIEKANRIYYLFFSIVSFSLALYSYFPARIFIPAYCLSLVIINYKIFYKLPKYFIISFFITAVFISPLLNHLINGEGLSRWNQVKGDLSFSSLVPKYFKYFSFDYLFFKGDIDMSGQFITRHSIRQLGENFAWQLPFFYYGLFLGIKKYRNKKYTIFLMWLFLYPLADLFTQESSPQATRSLIGVVPIIFFISIGIIHFINNLRQRFIKYLMILILLVFCLSSPLILFKSIKNYPLYSSDYWGWQYGAKPVMEYFLKNHPYYDRLCLEGVFNAPEIFIKFYDPQNICQNKCQICDYESQSALSKQLFAISSEKYQKIIEETPSAEIIVRKKIYYPDKSTAFFILEIK